MQFEIKRASSISGQEQPDVMAVCTSADEWGRTWIIEINTLEDLLALQKRVGSDLIVNAESIWIYDDYMG